MSIAILAVLILTVLAILILTILLSRLTLLAVLSLLALLTILAALSILLLLLSRLALTVLLLLLLALAVLILRLLALSILALRLALLLHLLLHLLFNRLLHVFLLVAPFLQEVSENLFECPFLRLLEASLIKNRLDLSVSGNGRHNCLDIVAPLREDVLIFKTDQVGGKQVDACRLHETSSRVMQCQAQCFAIENHCELRRVVQAVDKERVIVKTSDGRTVAGAETYLNFRVINGLQFKQTEVAHDSGFAAKNFKCFGDLRLSFVSCIIKFFFRMGLHRVKHASDSLNLKSSVSVNLLCHKITSIPFT